MQGQLSVSLCEFSVSLTLSTPTAQPSPISSLKLPPVHIRITLSWIPLKIQDSVRSTPDSRRKVVTKFTSHNSEWTFRIVLKISSILWYPKESWQCLTLLIRLRPRQPRQRPTFLPKKTRSREALSSISLLNLFDLSTLGSHFVVSIGMTTVFSSANAGKVTTQSSLAQFRRRGSRCFWLICGDSILPKPNGASSPKRTPFSAKRRAKKTRHSSCSLLSMRHFWALSTPKTICASMVGISLPKMGIPSCVVKLRWIPRDFVIACSPPMRLWKTWSGIATIRATSSALAPTGQPPLQMEFLWPWPRPHSPYSPLTVWWVLAL